ncbi:hypothetical protein SCP_1700200 [Sparassis crispa]|uniref:Uncharacterized protein n=1 Tax=Sparassis crispa TaxID=139825 RepID=A0A401H5H7_9APHY|nr:hypothetical protein SCP_1700200 [Sparassis crispa]GBE89696.1 hypothetical protein SCP_1700200 [Sparassis crispa]
MTLPPLTHNLARRTRPADTLLSTSTSTSVPPPLDHPPARRPHPIPHVQARSENERTTQPGRSLVRVRYGQGPGQLTTATAFPGRRDQAGWRQRRGLLVVSGRPGIALQGGTLDVMCRCRSQRVVPTPPRVCRNLTRCAVGRKLTQRRSTR